MKFDSTLYLVTDSTYHTENSFLETIEEACKGGITLLQLREKELNGFDFFHIAQKVKNITDSYEIPLIINDRVDIAMAVNADGVHVGASDIPIKYIRKIMGPEKIIGATVKTLDAAKRALTDGADYLGVGAIYPTTTKVVTVLTDVSILNQICDTIPIPVVAIGGLNESNVNILDDSKISGIAVVSAIMKSKNPMDTAEKLKEKVIEIKTKNNKL